MFAFVYKFIYFSLGYLVLFELSLLIFGVTCLYLVMLLARVSLFISGLFMFIWGCLYLIEVVYIYIKVSYLCIGVSVFNILFILIWCIQRLSVIGSVYLLLSGVFLLIFGGLYLMCSCLLLSRLYTLICDLFVLI